MGYNTDKNQKIDKTIWLLKWFEQRGQVPGETVEEKLKVNYFEAGLIDSFGVIEMISEIEEYFGINFSEKHFQERRFATIGGLKDIISELIDTGKNK
ncbi:acyl carrier protein [Desulfonauticus submarinus]